MNKRIVSILIILFIILWSGGGFTYGLFKLWPVVLFPIACYEAYVRKKQMRTSDYMLWLAIVVLQIFQQAKWGGNFNNTIATSFSVITIFLFCKSVAKDFCDLFYSIMVALAVISIVFWVIDVIPMGHNLLIKISNSIPQLGMENIWEIRDSFNFDRSNTLYFYSVNMEGSDFLPRNSGPLWEPGRYTVFLTFALLIGFYQKNKALFSFSNLMLLIANITTFSTTGYVAMALLLMGSVISKYKFSWRSIVLIVLLAYVAVYVNQLDFMAEKIANQYSSTNERSRFGAVLYHIPYILNSPIIGYGDRISLVSSGFKMSPNGWTYLLIVWGIPFSIFFMVLLFRSCRVLFDRNKLYGIFAFVVIFVLAFSQTIMTSPFYLCLYYIGLFLRTSKEEVKTNQSLYFERREVNS